MTWVKIRYLTDWPTVEPLRLILKAFPTHFAYSRVYVIDSVFWLVRKLFDSSSWFGEMGEKSTANVKSNQDFLRPHWFTIPVVDWRQSQIPWHISKEEGVCISPLDSEWTLGVLRWIECGGRNALSVSGPWSWDTDGFLFQSSGTTPWATRSPTTRLPWSRQAWKGRLRDSCRRCDTREAEMLDQAQLLPGPGSE